MSWVNAGSTDDLEPGRVKVVEIGDERIALCNVDGTFYAIDDECSHDGGPLGEGDLEGFNVICPRHGAEFDVRTGKVVQLPAVEDIPAYPVQVRDGMIFVGVPKE